MTDLIFINIGLILGITICISFFVQLLRQPLIISYIITGIICGPLLLNIINSKQEFFSIFAKFGVILLLFLIGLSLNLRFLKKIGKIAVITGIGQVIFTSIIGFIILYSLGFSEISSIFLAISITFSSTIIIIKLLSDKKELRTIYGRYTIGLMLVQDIIAILIMILLPAFQNNQSLIFATIITIVKSSILLVIVYFLSKFILSAVIEKIAKSGEFLFIFSLAWCFVIAGLAKLFGLTFEIGAIIAGLSLGSSVYQTEISSRIKPLRDFFIVIFFIILGSEMNISSFQSVLLPGLIISSFVLIGNPFILYFLYRRMKFTRRNSILAGLTAAQVSEFGFIFLFSAQQFGYIDDNIMPIFTIIALITIFISSYLISYNNKICKIILLILNKFFGKDKYLQKQEIDKKFDVLVFGYHRLGWKICETLSEMKISFAVVDCDPLAIHKLEDRKIPYFFGDASDVEFIDELPLSKTKMIISTLPRADSQITFTKHIRIKNKKIIILANLSHIRCINDLYEVGVDYIMIPHLLSGLWMAEVLKNMSLTKKTFIKLRNDQKKEMLLKYNK